MKTEDIRCKVMSVLDGLVKDIGKEQYAEVLDEIGSDIELRLECVNAELEDEGVSE